ncbi:MAG TPA: type I restriction enzyme HsdR N-terminal domain-containing protein [Chloroflexia bacterium]|jgi:hypothetical protein
MAKAPSVTEIVEEIFQSILATPKRQRRLLSKTFWDKFGFKVRSKERIEQVTQELKKRQGLIINPDISVLGSEAKDEWIILTYIEPPGPSIDLDAQPENVLTPDDSWFTIIEQREFESEREVEYYFIMPLLERLGYAEEDCVIGHPITIFRGTKPTRTQADVVLFNGQGRSKDDALLVVEAKKGKLTEDAISQARSYAQELATPYYLVTNGLDIRLYVLQGGGIPDALAMDFNRNEFKERWSAFYQILNKKEIIGHKERVRQFFGNSK